MSCSSAAQRSTRSGPAVLRGRSPAAARSANAGRRPCAGGARRSPSASRRSRAAPRSPRPVSHHQVDTRRPGSAPSSSLSSSAATRSAVMRPSCAGHLLDRLAHPRRDGEAELRDEPRGPQHPQRIVAERHLRRGGRVEHAVRAAPSKPPSGSRNSPGPSAVMRTAIALAVKSRRTRSSSRRSPKRTCGIARHLVVGVGAEGGDLHAVAALADADGAELDAGVPQRVGPRPQDALHLLGPGVGGEVEVGAEPAEQRVAHTAADQIQLVARVGEQRCRARAARRRAGSAPPGQRRAVQRRLRSGTFDER